MSKYIFITGGVISSLGKGITAASIGAILKRRGCRIRLQKFDPYINVDPGTMNPFQHGEVYVTEDGTETDLDLGHYERYTGQQTGRDSNFTSGQIYASIIEKERRGDFLGGTVQVVPHVTHEIKTCVRKLSAEDVDVVISEIGGTVGDIEGLPFLEAIRQMRHDEGRGNVLYIHLTLVPYIRAAGEIKTKPTQQSVGKLREIGIQPDILICRSEVSIGDEARRKIALFCNVDEASVIEEKDVEHSIYEIPKLLMQQRLDEIIARDLQLNVGPPEMEDWEDMLERLLHPSDKVRIAVVGKYIRLQDAYKSIYEALTHAGIANHVQVDVVRLEAEELIQGDLEEQFKDVQGILVPGGFGTRGVEGKIKAVQYARERSIPFLGICLGMQCAVIEFARSVLRWEKANSAEFELDTPYPVIALLDEQRRLTAMGGTMRLGAYPGILVLGSKAMAAYGAQEITERHRHRYEFNNDFREAFESAGMLFSGLSPDGKLVEILELKDHPWFVATQAHPEFKSRPTEAHPLFREFVSVSRGI